MLPALSLSLFMGERNVGGAAAPAPRTTQFVATGGVVPYNTPATATSTTLCRQDRTRHRIGAAGFTEMAVQWCNFYVSTTNVETNLAAITDLQASITMNGVTKRLTFSSSNSTSMTAGQANVTSDLVTPGDFGLTPATSAGVNFYIFCRMVVADGTTYRIGAHIGSTTQPAGEPANSIGGILSDASNDQVMAGVALNVTGVTVVVPMPPLSIIGKTNGPTKSILFVGDSIMQGINDTGNAGLNDGSAGGGYNARACYSEQAPYCNIGRFGSAILGFTGANTLKRAPLYAYATHALVNYGSNDISTTYSQTAAATLTRLQALYPVLKAAGIRYVEQQNILPRTTSSDAWKTAVNQTIATNFEQTGTSPRDVLNAGISSTVGTNSLDSLFDINAISVDAVDYGKWFSDGVTNFLRTNDGVHFSGNAGATIGAAMVSRIQAWPSY